MATTSTGAGASRADRGTWPLEWLQLNARLLGAGAAVLAVAGAGYWFYIRSRQIRAVNAERSLFTAQQSLASGNTALAISDLQKVVSRYEGTGSGTEAALLLGTTYFNQGKFQDGINQLQKVAGKAGGSDAAVYGLIGDGYSQLGKLTDAAKAYEQAGAAGRFDNEKAYFRAKAARSWAAAGKVAEARKLWGDLAGNPKASAVAAEARVRLAELDAKPAGKS